MGLKVHKLHCNIYRCGQSAEFASLKSDESEGYTNYTVTYIDVFSLSEQSASLKSDLSGGYTNYTVTYIDVVSLFAESESLKSDESEGYTN